MKSPTIDDILSRRVIGDVFVHDGPMMDLAEYTANIINAIPNVTITWSGCFQEPVVLGPDEPPLHIVDLSDGWFACGGRRLDEEPGEGGLEVFPGIAFPDYRLAWSWVDLAEELA